MSSTEIITAAKLQSFSQKGLAINVSPFDSRCKKSHNSPKLQGIGKISAEKKKLGLF
jgi:hypothetical protein